MSNEELARIGAAHVELKSAKADSEYLEKKIERLCAACRAVSSCLQSSVEYQPRVEDGKLHFPYSKEPFSAEDLVDAARLKELIEARAKAETRLKAALETAASLGISLI
jgi:hypothetical protein